MTKIKYFLDWLFKDFNGRNGKYVIAEAPNISLSIFMVFIVLAIVVYPGFVQGLCFIIAYLALGYWSYMEAKTGRSKFRKSLGYVGMLTVIGAFLMWLSF